MFGIKQPWEESDTYFKRKRCAVTDLRFDGVINNRCVVPCSLYRTGNQTFGSGDLEVEALAAVQ